MNLPIDFEKTSPFNLFLFRLKMLKILFTEKKVIVTSINRNQVPSTKVFGINIDKEEAINYFFKANNILREDQYLDRKLNQNISSILNN